MAHLWLHLVKIDKMLKVSQGSPCGFIQNEDRWVFDESTGNGNALFLSTWHSHPSFPEHRVVALGEASDEGVSVGQFGRFKHLVRQVEEWISNCSTRSIWQASALFLHIILFLYGTGHPCLFQNCSQWPPAEKTGRGSLLNCPSCPSTNPVNQETELNCMLVR